MTRTIFDGPQALVAAVGTRLGPTAPRVLDQDDVNTFARLTDDPQWIHTDPERAAASPFGGTIVHGFFVLSMCSAVLDELQNTTGFSAGLNYGLDRVRFPSSLPTGAEVQGEIELVSATERPDGIQAVWRIELRQPGAERPVCVADMISRYIL